MHGAQVLVGYEVYELSSLLLRDFVVRSASPVQALSFECSLRLRIGVGNFLSGRSLVVLRRKNLEAAHIHGKDTLI